MTTGIIEFKNTIIIMLAGVALYHIAQISGMLGTIVSDEVPPAYADYTPSPKHK